MNCPLVLNPALISRCLEPLRWRRRQMAAMTSNARLLMPLVGWKRLGDTPQRSFVARRQERELRKKHVWGRAAEA